MNRLAKHRKLFDEIGIKLGIQVQEDWYKVTRGDVINCSKHGRTVLINSYKSSMYGVLSKAYPQFDWKIWRFNLAKRSWNNPSICKDCVEWIESQLGIANKEQWYTVTLSDLRRIGVEKVVKRFGGSIWKLVEFAFPEYEWLPWKFERVPNHNLWANTVNQKKFFDWLGEHLSIKSVEQWNRIGANAVKNRGGEGILEPYGGSIQLALQTIYPEKNWFPWLSSASSNPLEVWSSRETQTKYLDWLGASLRIEKPEDWYGVTHVQITLRGGEAFLNHINNDFPTAVIGCYPHLNLLPWKFTLLPSDYWNNQQFREQYMDWLAEELGIQTQDDWYCIRSSHVHENSGRGLLNQFDGSFLKALQCVYPQFTWFPWLAMRSERGMWNDTQVQREYIKWFEAQTFIEKPEDWYGVSFEDLYLREGEVLMRMYDSNVYNMLNALCPEYGLHPWLFNKVPKSFWLDIENHRRCVDWIAKKLNLEKPEDWYSVTVDQVRQTGAGRILAFHSGSVTKMVRTLYPNVSLMEKMSHGEWCLWYVLKCIPTIRDEFQVNYEHPRLIHEDTGMKMELDFYIPSLGIALEYQGLQHYTEAHNDSLSTQKQRDINKKKICKDMGIALIEVPPWWDGSPAVLLDIINSHCPDIEIEVTT